MKLISSFDRTKLVDRLGSQETWDIIVIGGGATGLGISIDAAARGYSTLLIEQHDFAKGTSSRSTKLIHGGVRYLAQGNIKLVYTALQERGILLRNAAHLVRPQSFIIPCYNAWEQVKYLAGLKIYDLLAGKYSLGRSVYIPRRELIARQRRVQQKNLKGGVEYFDGQFDDARLAVNMAQTAVEQGAVVLNYFAATALVKENGKVAGIQIQDRETNQEYTMRANAVINATGVFVDDVLQMDNPSNQPMVTPSQGVHVVVASKFLDGKAALMIPKTPDGRVLFAVPWHEHLLVGTTDTPVERHSLEPVPLKKEIRFILDTLKAYVDPAPAERDVLSVFAGLRPLAASSADGRATKEISRDHKLVVSDSGLITITGGKWTTYRKMAEETVTLAALSARLQTRPCTTRNIPLHGNRTNGSGRLRIYGSDAEGINRLMDEDPALNKPLVHGHGYTVAEVVWAARHEMARSVEDVLARRLRLLFLDARAAIAAAPTVALLLARELQKNDQWASSQVSQFKDLANKYVLDLDETISVS